MKLAASERLRFLLATVEKEKEHLLLTTSRLFAQKIDAAWISSLEANPDLAERLDAFVARFNRLQDTIGDKLIPELMRNMQETPGAALDNLGRMEKLGLLASVEEWIEARNLRNRLVHEYMHEPGEFAEALKRAGALVPLLTATDEALRRYVDMHLVIKE
ncbi:MAG: hypothetical protein CVV05_07455 [Gammaproteobacteria bacterium HGW-Gammaproteobacteria-1]|nr:MAG: hypothetical protein CVV05_07455 [Gammaproteobacteria bacterium HGW-Gammaproteobacteria-1]